MRTFSHTALSLLVSLAALVTLGACAEVNKTPVPDYRIRVVQSPDGTAHAVPPACPSWVTGEVKTLDNQPWEQFGCATKRNLALMVEDPKDLVAPEGSAGPDAPYVANSVDLYRTSKTKPLQNITASTTSN